MHYPPSQPNKPKHEITMASTANNNARSTFVRGFNRAGNANGEAEDVEEAVTFIFPKIADACFEHDVNFTFFSAVQLISFYYPAEESLVGSFIFHFAMHPIIRQYFY